MLDKTGPWESNLMAFLTVSTGVSSDKSAQ